VAGLRLRLDAGPTFVRELSLGASVAVDGVCLTVTGVEGSVIAFDVIGETLRRTTLGSLQSDRPLRAAVSSDAVPSDAVLPGGALGSGGGRSRVLVNVERSLRVGDEIGGHEVSGHVSGTATVLRATRAGPDFRVELGVPEQWLSCLFPQGFVAVDGASLTLVSVTRASFAVHLIPETLRRTQLGLRRVGDAVNVELDARTVAVVRTVERVLERAGRPGAPA
jgi:riboflavin synthase